MNTITFDVNCADWTQNQEMNYHFLRCQIEYLRDMMMARGYVYLNQIYEHLGASWNPDWDNICYKAVNGLLGADIKPGLGDVYFIEITQN